VYWSNEDFGQKVIQLGWSTQTCHTSQPFTKKWGLVLKYPRENGLSGNWEWCSSFKKAL